MGRVCAVGQTLLPEVSSGEGSIAGEEGNDAPERAGETFEQAGGITVEGTIFADFYLGTAGRKAGNDWFGEILDEALQIGPGVEGVSGERQEHGVAVEQKQKTCANRDYFVVNARGWIL